MPYATKDNIVDKKMMSAPGSDALHLKNSQKWPYEIHPTMVIPGIKLSVKYPISKVLAVFGQQDQIAVT